MRHLDTESRFMLAFYTLLGGVTAIFLVIALLHAELAPLLLIVGPLFAGMWIVFSTLRHADD